MRFARILRAAGVPVGPGRVLDGVNALAAIDVTQGTDFYWALHAVFVSRPEQHELFDQAFRVFFRTPDAVDPMMAALLPSAPPRATDLSRRILEAFARPRPLPPKARKPEDLEHDAVLTWSDRETLRRKDFEEMTVEELRRARQAIARLRLPVPAVATRRLAPDPHGPRVDLRATLRAAGRRGGELALRFRIPVRRPPPIVALCDISGSMERYTRVLVHFLHAITNDRPRVSTFLFGTRVTNVTRQLRHRDVDHALARVGAAASDWGGGTRIGRCLAEFNRRWARRVLGQGAVVLLITDGLDRDDATGLAREMERLHRSCRKLVWLNPLLRYEGFEPRAAGIRAMLPHVDEHRAAHDLASLEELVAALGLRQGRHDETSAGPPLRSLNAKNPRTSTTAPTA